MSFPLGQCQTRIQTTSFSENSVRIKKKKKNWLNFLIWLTNIFSLKTEIYSFILCFMRSCHMSPFVFKYLCSQSWYWLLFLLLWPDLTIGNWWQRWLFSLTEEYSPLCKGGMAGQLTVQKCLVELFTSWFLEDIGSKEQT